MSTTNEEEVVDETLDKIAELLNEALASNKDSLRVNHLRIVQEIILNKNPALLDSFLDEILQFQLDRSVEVKKIVINFIEEACKRDQEAIFNIIDNFRYLLFDDNVNVQKRAFLSMINIFKNTLKWMEKQKESVGDHHQQAWLSMLAIKDHIVSQIDSDNDGVRTIAIKFIEMLVIILSPRIKESLIPSVNENDISIDQISDDHPVLNKSMLQEQGRACLRKLLDYTLSIHISSVNLITSINVLSNVAKQRPEFMEIVLDTYKRLLENIPPTLGQSQVSTVKKQMKLQVLAICKNSCCVEFHTQIIHLLTELGASQSEISKALPKSSSSDFKKRSHSSSVIEASQLAKKPKPLATSITATTSVNVTDPVTTDLLPSLDQVVGDLTKKLHIRENVADLVICSMSYLPEQLPSDFVRVYKPISDAGTLNQIKNLARLLALFLNQVGVLKLKTPPPSTLMGDKKALIDDLDNEEDSTTSQSRLKSERIDSLTDSSKATSSKTAKPVPGTPTKPLQSILPRCTNKTFKLTEVTLDAARSRFNPDSMEELLLKTHNRILESDEIICNSKEASLVRKRILVETTSLPNYANHLLSYIFEDVKKRIDLGLMWIFNNFLNMKRAQQRLEQASRRDTESMKDEVAEIESDETKQSLRLEIEKHEQEYDNTLYTILYNLQHRQEPKDLLFSKTICQVPLVTDNCLDLLREFCENETKFYFSMTTLYDLILTRYTQRDKFLQLLLDLTRNENAVVRENAINICLRLHQNPEFTGLIEGTAIDRVQLLTQPPADELTSEWTQNSIKSCLYLLLSLMPSNHSLIHSLAQVFINSSSDVKRTIVKSLDIPIKSIGADSTELLKLIQDFPEGAETLILGIIHILTEKNKPSIDLVNRVRFLYEKKLSDVRFLIPILAGLTKKEIISALPSLIKLSPAVVKEVFNRLLGPISPITPAELLIALHKIDPTVCDLKTIINATSFCFADKQIYNQEVLATVMQQLIDVTPIPTLYMRTVIQSVTIHPKLTSFVLIMLQRLIGKQVWKYPKVWEGFIKCCQRVKASCHQVLLQLPPQQLKEVFTAAPDLKEHMNKHVQALNPQQRAQIPEKLMELIEQQIQPVSAQ